MAYTLLLIRLNKKQIMVAWKYKNICIFFGLSLI